MNTEVGLDRSDEGARWQIVIDLARAGGDPRPALDEVAYDLLGARAPRALRSEIDRLLDLSYEGYPLAALVAGAAGHDLRRGDPRVEALVAAAWAELMRGQDGRALGQAADLRASLAVARGDLEEAVSWWRRCVQLLEGDAPPAAGAWAHLSIEAYQQGDLRTALMRAGLALERARAAGVDDGSELVALVYLLLYTVTAGDFGAADRVLADALAVWARVAPSGTRDEGPLLFAFAGALAGLRGDRSAADLAFDRALALADELDSPWHQAIALATRAEFTSSWAHHRSLSDAVCAQELAERLGDQWWSALARLAEGAAQQALGHYDEAEAALARALDELTNPLERARALLYLGETRLAAGRRRSARAALRQALAVIEVAGSTYLEARLCSALATAERDRGGDWRARAAGCVGDDPAYARLAPGAAALRIELGSHPSVSLDGQRVAFITRHAECTVYLLALAGPRGLDLQALAEVLWPGAPPERVGPRTRTLLWQVRNCLGAEAWRMVRTGDRVSLDLVGVEVVQPAEGDGPVLGGWRVDAVLAELDLDLGLERARRTTAEAKPA